MKNGPIFGIAITLLGGILWGFSGACGQYLFEHKGVSADWLVPWRLFVSGAILLAINFIRVPALCLSIFARKARVCSLIFYAIFGLCGAQYGYFYSIELSNAATATAIQYTAPAFILIYVCLQKRRMPKFFEILALFLAMSGVFLLATHGEAGGLMISKKALFFALASALCVVVYNVSAKGLLRMYPVSLVLGWGMLIGGVILGAALGVWNLRGASDAAGFAAFFCIVIFGTILAFCLYMSGVKIIGPARASVIAAIEPVSAAMFAYLWLQTPLVLADAVGIALILSCLFLLSRR